MISTREQVRPAPQHDRPARHSPAPEQARLPRPVLAAVLLAIRLDCLVEPERYLDEVCVPFGGE